MAFNLHPADLADRQKVATATHFNVHLRRNPGDVTNTQAPTLIEAVKIAGQMAPTPSGKKPMIYAVTPDRQSVLVPADIIEAARLRAMADDHENLDADDEAEIAKFEAKATAIEQASGLSGQQIAQLTAMITGGGYKRANSRDAAVKRFENVAAQAGFGEVAIRYTLKQPSFDEAGKYVMAVLREQRVIAEDRAEAATGARKPEKAVAAWKTAKRTPAPASGRPIGRRAEIVANAAKGILPPAPDFSAETHRRFRGKLAEIVKLVEAGDVAALKAIEIKAYSSSPKALDRYRNLAVIALEATVRN